MRVTAFPTQTQRTRYDMSVKRAENRRLRASTASLRSMRHPPSGVSATPETLRGKRCLIQSPDQAISALDGTPLGECRSKQRDADDVASRYSRCDLCGDINGKKWLPLTRALTIAGPTAFHQLLIVRSLK